MIKNLSLLLAFILVLGLSFVIADSQTIDGEVSGFAEFNLDTTSVDYGSVNPGSQSADQVNQITVTENNNVDFTIDIALSSDPDSLFTNIFFDLDDSSSYEESEQLDETLVWSITNQNGEFTETVNSMLSVPAGFLPVDSTGTIEYTITVSP